MTIPAEPTAPETVGTAPRNAAEVNGLVGLHLRDFLRAKAVINQDHEFFLPTDLTAAPYFYTEDQQTLIKSAYGDLDTTLDGIDLTFINRLVGMG